MDLPLEGVRVLEVGGGIAAGYAAHWFAGFGADVVRVEGAGHVPLSDDELVYLVAGKRRVEASGDTLRRLCLAADVVIEDRAPGAMAVMGCDPALLRAEKPSLVVLSISPFGQHGPYRDWKATNLVSYAMGSLMSLTGDPQRPPLVTGGSQAQYFGGLHGAAVALTTYWGALVHGEGDWIDLSLQEVAAGTTELYGAGTAMGGPVQSRMGNHVRAEWAIYPCMDGWAGMFALQRQVRGLFEAVGDPELLEDPKFMDPLWRIANPEELEAKMYVFTLDRTKQQLLDLGREKKVPIGVSLTPADLLASQALAERGMFDEVATPEGTARVPGRPVVGLGWQPPGRLHDPAADTAAVVEEWLA